MTTRKLQTLIQAVHLATSGKSRDMARVANRLDGLPFGGWGETAQAMREIADYLPMRGDRAYTVGHIVDALYSVEGPDSGRYVRRSTEDALAAAARIEIASAGHLDRLEADALEALRAAEYRCETLGHSAEGVALVDAAQAAHDAAHERARGRRS